jgi:hypothetical protein
MLLVSDTEEGKIRYICPCCTSTVDVDPGCTHTILTRRPQNASDRYARFLTPDLAQDATLPRLPETPCPFCHEVGGIMFVKYSKQVEYLYHCGKCVKFWLNEQAGPSEVAQT